MKQLVLDNSQLPLDAVHEGIPSSRTESGEWRQCQLPDVGWLLQYDNDEDTLLLNKDEAPFGVDNVVVVVRNTDECYCYR
jgi:hypothetical protein